MGFQDDLGNDLEYNGYGERYRAVKEVLVVDAHPGDRCSSVAEPCRHAHESGGKKMTKYYVTSNEFISLPTIRGWRS